MKQRDIQCCFLLSSLSIFLVAAGSSGARHSLWLAQLMAERSTLNRWATSLLVIDKFCVAT
jgi:hypothetical protein